MMTVCSRGSLKVLGGVRGDFRGREEEFLRQRLIQGRSPCELELGEEVRQVVAVEPLERGVLDQGEQRGLRGSREHATVAS